MDPVADFVLAYERELDFYEAAARVARQHLESALRSNGIKAITSSRAKRRDSLETKLRKRALEGRTYRDLAAIREDMADLAGVRVALYFPRDREQVNKLVGSLFHALAPPKEMPDPDARHAVTDSGDEYIKRFAGYRATHHRVKLLDGQVSDEDKRLLTARIEIQVASVLMHAWSEVEHDLVYKPLSGKLSTEEHELLDQINGLVMAGEMALERLQGARDRRLDRQSGPFDSQFELASYLFEHARRVFGRKADDEAMGRADWLFNLLEVTSLNSRDKLAPFLDALEPDFEQRTIAEQVIDKVVAGNEERYQIFQALKKEQPVSPSAHTALGEFLVHWIKLEGVLTQLAQPPQVALSATPRPRAFPLSMRALIDSGAIDADTFGTLERVRRLRNDVVHGLSDPSPALMEEARTSVDSILQILAKSAQPRSRRLAIEALEGLGISVDQPESSDKRS